MVNKSKYGIRREANSKQKMFGFGFNAYDPDIFDLISLHLWSNKTRDKRGRVTSVGKAPINARWSTMDVNSRRTRTRCLIKLATWV